MPSFAVTLTIPEQGASSSLKAHLKAHLSKAHLEVKMQLFGFTLSRTTDNVPNGNSIHVDGE